MTLTLSFFRYLLYHVLQGVNLTIIIHRARKAAPYMDYAANRDEVPGVGYAVHQTSISLAIFHRMFYRELFIECDLSIYLYLLMCGRYGSKGKRNWTETLRLVSR